VERIFREHYVTEKELAEAMEQLQQLRQEYPAYRDDQLLLLLYILSRR
jgi:hypothetical protein